MFIQLESGAIINTDNVVKVSRLGLNGDGPWIVRYVHGDKDEITQKDARTFMTLVQKPTNNDV